MEKGGFTTGLAIMGFAGEVLKLWGGRVNREGKAFTQRGREREDYFTFWFVCFAEVIAGVM